MSAVAAGAIAAASAIGTQANANKMNKHAARVAYQRNIRMWHMQNEYNTPSAQMERFKEAGLNPNLIYGQGNSGNAGAPPQYDPPKYEGHNPVPDFVGVHQTYLNAKQIEAGIEQVQANTELIRQRTNTEFINQALKGLGKTKLAVDINRLESLLPYQTAIAKGQAEASDYKAQELVTRIAGMGAKQATELLNQELMRKRITTQEQVNANLIQDWIFKNKTNELRKLGLTDKNNPVVKLLATSLSNSLQGDTIEKKARSLWDLLMYYWKF